MSVVSPGAGEVCFGLEFGVMDVSGDVSVPGAPAAAVTGRDGGAAGDALQPLRAADSRIRNEMKQVIGLGLSCTLIVFSIISTDVF